jgi:tetraacyldisaccharide 4'-kinase
VAILSRGYRRGSKGTVIVSDGTKILVGLKDAGDEPYLLANQLKKIPVVVEADRYKGALTIQEQFRPDIILLDDAFQHRRIQRDLDIVLVDASVGFGWGLLLPAGFLREPIHSLKRSNLIWLTRVDQAKNVNKIVEKVRRYSPGPVIASEHRATEVIQGNTGTCYELSFLKNKRILLFSGIANPGSFEKTVIGLGGKVVHHQLFPDHYQYLQSDITKIIKKGEKQNANIILTTEKDFVRIKNLIHNVSNIYYLTIEIQIGNYRDILESVLNRLL